jgi:imidazolonepropionase-like amidohydrolase
MPGERIDLRGAWVLPGLIDAHLHVESIAAARCMLSLGVTTGRSMFTRGYADVGLRTLHKHGDADIPNFLAAGYPVLACMLRFEPDLSGIFFDYPELDDLRKIERIGPDGAPRIVRANADRHVDWIKVFANERAGDPGTDPSTRNLNDEELRAAVEEATRLGLPSAAHAYSDEGVAAAVNAGVRSVEHGSLITEPTVKLMHERGVAFVPTLFTLKPNASHGESSLQPRMKLFFKSGCQAVMMARRLGVPVIAGSDSGYVSENHSVIDEIIVLASAGLSNLEAIRSATSLSAECLKISSAKGALKPGLDADLVAYEENPVKDLSVLRKPILVINGGKVFLRKNGVRTILDK